MSVRNDLRDAIVDSLRSLHREVADADVAEIADKLAGSRYKDIVIEYVDKLDRYLDDLTAKMSADDYEDEIQHFGNLVAETMLLDACDVNRVSDQLLQDEYDDFRESKAELNQELKNCRGSGRRRDRDSGSSARRPRGRDGANERRANRSNLRDEAEQPAREEKPAEMTRSTRRGSNVAVETPANEPLQDGEVITSANVKKLATRILPMYFAGLEKLVYRSSSDSAEIVIPGGSVDVDYVKHRTDIYLRPNVQPTFVAKTIEMMNEELLKASQKVVNDWIGDEDKRQARFSTLKVANKRTNFGQPMIVDELFELDCLPVGDESKIRDALIELDIDDVIVPNFNAIGLTIRHILAETEAETQSADDKAMLEAMGAQVIGLMRNGSIAEAKIFVNSLYEALPHAIANSLFQIINDAVCQALTIVRRSGVRTASFVLDYDAIVGMFTKVEKTDPNFQLAFQTILKSFIPYIEASPEGIAVTRNYLFIPINSCNLVFAGAGWVAAITEKDRPELFKAIDKLVNTEAGKIAGNKATLVTLDNRTLDVCLDHSSIQDKRYLIFKNHN